MNAPGNTLVVHVVSVTGLSIKGTKAVDIYCSLSTSGKGPWKSKVSTNTLRAEPQQFGAELRWDEHCEFQLNDTDTRLIVHVNHKTVFGTTETLGELIFQLDEMPRFQPPAWFRLSKVSSSDVQRGQIQLGYQFSNTLGIGGRQNGTSVSNMSLNKIEKENKLNRIRRKMQQLGRKATGGGSSQSTAGDDSQSLASISIAAGHSTTLSMGRRRSSVSSTNSGALAFSSPSPNPPTPVPATVDDFQKQQEQSSLQPTVQSSRKGAGSRNASTSNWTNTASSSGGGNSRTTSANGDGMVSMLDKNLSTTTTTATSEGQMTPTPRARLSRNFLQPPHQSHESAEFDDQTSMGGHSSVSGGSVFGGGHQLTSAADPQTPTPQQPPKLRVKMRQKAEQLLQLRSFTSSGKKHQHHEAPNDPDLTLPDHSNGSRNAKKHQQQQQRRDSVASSSGFVSFGSGQLSTLNEQTSPEHLLNVIKHLRKELLQKEERIRDLEEYTDRLTSKVMTTNPELLATSPKIGAPRIRH